MSFWDDEEEEWRRGICECKSMAAKDELVSSRHVGRVSEISNGHIGSAEGEEITAEAGEDVD